MSTFTDSFKEFFAPLNTAQQIMFIGLSVAVVAVVGTIFYWTLKPDYSLLFGSLQAESAREITQKLDEQGVGYEIQDGGRSIYVRDDKVDELRIQMAPLGAPDSDMKGYELFDSNSLGMTDFMQQLNNKRALEGELARSINSLSQIESSRVHLVLPERSPFEQASVDASASVIVTLQRGKRLTEQQVKGIIALIAGSVDGLKTDGVTIIDQAGNRLTDGLESESDFASGFRQMQLRQNIETYLAKNGQTMLDRVLGPGNSVVRVAVEHDFDQLVRESELVDPESQTIISEERTSEIHNDEQREMVPIDEFTPVNNRGETVVVGENENETNTRTRNYEVSKTREVFTKSQGEIAHVSASVLINFKQVMQENEEGEQVPGQEPYTPEELEGFREIISMAVGIQPERGDQIRIEQVQFWNPEDPQNVIDQPTPWSDVYRWILILLSFLAIVALIYNMRRRLGYGENQIVLGYPDAGDEGVVWTEDGPQRIEDMSEEEQAAAADNQLVSNSPLMIEEKDKAVERIKVFIEMKPSEAAQVLRVMLASDNK